MRQSICRPLLVLALLVPLSRSSLGDTFAVGGTLIDSGDEEFGSITLPSFTFNGGSAVTWGSMNSIWTIGSVLGTEIDVNDAVSLASWSFDGFTGSNSSGTFHAAAECTVEDDGCTGAPATWTGELDLSGSGGLLFEIEMAGTGTASFGGLSIPPLDDFLLTSGTADVTGVGQVIYEAPSVPEPGTLTLMGIAGIASILAKRFRRR